MGSVEEQPQDPGRAPLSEWAEWSRHYDNLTWGVIVIFTATVGALLAYSFSESGAPPIPSSDKGPLPEIAGLTLTFLGVFYVASFRRFRHRIHEKLPKGDLKEYLENPGGDTIFHQWNVFVLPFVTIDVFFVYRLARRTACWSWVFGFGIFVVFFVFWALWKWGGSKKHKVRDSA